MPNVKKEFPESKEIHQKIVEKVSKYYEEQGYSIHSPVKLGRFIADLIAVRDQNLVIAIEAKKDDLSEIRKGVGQALSYMEWTHKVYLAIPLKRINICQELLKHTPIGILSVAEDQVLIVKEADFKEPDRTKLYQLLFKTTGFCWMCGRPFNLIESASKPPNSIIIADKEKDPILIKKLEQIMGTKIYSLSYWVGICKICSRILGEAIYEFFEILLKKPETTIFDFGDVVFIDDLRERIFTRTRELQYETV